jgi:hypothetical protein
MGERPACRTDAADDSTCCRNPVAGKLLLALTFYRVQGETGIAANPRLAFEETGGT